MKFSNGNRKVVGGLSVVSLIVVFCFNVYASDRSFKTIEKNGKLAIFDPKTNRLTGYLFDTVYESPYYKPKAHNGTNLITKFPYQGLILVKKDGKFAYLNEKFREVVAYGTYDSITPMNYYGYSTVKKGGKWGIINKHCQLVAPIRYDLISQEPSVCFENAFKSFLVKINDKFRILNKDAKPVLQLEFDSVEILDEHFYLAHAGKKLYLINDNCSVLSDYYTSVSSIYEGFIVKKDNKTGIVDHHNRTLIPFIYDSIYAPRFDPCYFATKNDACGVIDLKGKTLIPFEYEQILESWENTNNEDKHLIVQKNQKFGTISFTNKAVIPIEFDGISDWVEDGPPAHYVVKNEKWGLMSYDGKVFIPAIYNSLLYHTNSIIGCEKNGKYGILDINNKEIVPCVNDSLVIDYDSYGHTGKKGQFSIKNNGIWKHLDLNGKPIEGIIREEEVEK